MFIILRLIRLLTQFPYLSKSHYTLQRGQVYIFFSHLEMQWKWNAWLQVPHATLHSSVPPLSWLAWHSIQTSIRCCLHIEHWSYSPSHFHIVTALHFFIVNFSLQSFFELVESICIPSIIYSFSNQINLI